MKKSILVGVVAILAIFSLVFVGQASTNEYIVDVTTFESTAGGCDAAGCSFEDAWSAANNDGTDSVINFDLDYPAIITTTAGDGTAAFYNITDDGALLIQGPGSENLTFATVSGDAWAFLMAVEDSEVNPANVAFSGLTFDGYTFDFVIANKNNTFEDIVFGDNLFFVDDEGGSLINNCEFSKSSTWTTDDVTVSNSTFDNVNLQVNGSNWVVEGNDFLNCEGETIGLYLTPLASNTLVSENTFTDNVNAMLMGDGGTDNVISNNTFTNNGNHVWYNDDTTISDNTFTITHLWLKGDGWLVEGNEFSGNTEYAPISFQEDSSNNTVTENNFFDNEYRVITLGNPSTNNTISDNTFINNQGDSVINVVAASDNNVFFGNTFEESGYDTSYAAYEMGYTYDKTN